MAKTSLEQLCVWKTNPEKHRAQLADVYGDRENDPEVRSEVVRIWLTQPVIFFAELSSVLDQGEYELKNLVNELLDTALKNDGEGGQQ